MYVDCILVLYFDCIKFVRGLYWIHTLCMLDVNYIKQIVIYCKYVGRILCVGIMVQCSSVEYMYIYIYIYVCVVLICNIFNVC